MKEIDAKVREKDYVEFSHIMKSVRFMHVGGLLFSMIAFWIIGYKYLLESPLGHHLLILMLPFVLFLLYWVPKMVGVEKEVSFLSRESIVQISIQIIFLILICLDFFGLITIP